MLRKFTQTAFLEEKMNYIHNNPVKAELVGRPEDYLYSSARDIQEKMDWLKYFFLRYFKRITDPKLRGADCKSAPAAAKITTYPEEYGAGEEVETGHALSLRRTPIFLTFSC